MREIEKAFKGDWGEYVSQLIKENNRSVITSRIKHYINSKDTRSATYSELHKQLKIPQSTLNDVLKDTTALGWFVKRFNEETKQLEYYSPFPHQIQGKLADFVHDARDPIWCYVYDNPKLSPSIKAEIALEYIMYLLDEYNRQYKIKLINKFFQGLELKTDFQFQNTETQCKINSALAKKFGFADELHKQLIEKMPTHRPRRPNQVIEITRTKLKKYKLPTSIF